MPFDPTDTIEVPRVSDGNVEQLRPFIPTPERVSQYLELKTDEVTAQMKSVEGRQALLKQLMEHEEDLRKDHADFQPELLQTQLDEVGETLGANERYLQDIQSPEKKGMFRRAWESVKGFPRNHPVVTALLAVAALTGGVAGGLYVTGNLEMVLAALASAAKMATGAVSEGMGTFDPVTPLPIDPTGGGPI